MAINKLDTGAIQDNAITNAKMADDAVGVADLAATGTPSNTTFLRGDNAWATPTDTNTTYSVQDGELSQNNFTNDDHTKLNNIEASATADQTNDEIKAAVEAASDSNTFTDADHTKLNAIEASADVTDATNVAAAGAVMTQYVHPNHSGDVVSAADGAMTIQTDAVDIAMLSATGTPGNTTFLRGDNAWATAGSTSASDLTSGTLPMARLSGTLPALNGSALTNLPSDVIVATSAPSSPATGDLWFNSTSGNNTLNVYNGASWNQLSNTVSATGGTERTYSGYKSHTFTSSGTFQITSGSPACDVLIVAGGGGGGGRNHSGGGGAGGVRVFTSQVLNAGSYTITVGAGGGDVAVANVQGSMGNTSTFQGIASSSGGGGGAAYDTAGLSGGSGGGDNGGQNDNTARSPGSGNAGGYSPVEGYAGAATSVNTGYVAGGGGGGASETGGHTNKISDGGAGISNAFSTGSNISYGGGGVGSNGYGTDGQSGTPAATHGGGVMDAVGAANTGGGGGSGSTGSSPGKSGGSGIVVVRYAV